MAEPLNQKTRNIRIPEKVHEQIKLYCRREGLLIGSYVAKILKAAISRANDEEAPN